MNPRISPIGRLGSACVVVSLAWLVASAPASAGACCPPWNQLAESADGSVVPVEAVLREVAVAKGVFLVAKPHLRSHYFGHSVVLIIEHDDDGSVGVIVNRRSDVSLSRLLPDFDEIAGDDDFAYLGGPVAKHVIVLLARSSSRPETAIPVLDDVYFSTSKDVLTRLLQRPEPGESVHAYVGYSGWAPGQLADEISRGDWYVIPADAGTIFEWDADTVWRRLFERLSRKWVHHPNSDPLSPGRVADSQRVPG